MTKLKTLTTALLLGSAVTATVYAAPGGDRMKKMFEELDADKNGVVTHAEVMAKSQLKFNEFDKNGDGFLELAELPEVMPVPDRMKKRMEKRAKKLQERVERKGIEDIQEVAVAPTRLKFVARHDRDGDERVSVEEFSVRAIKMFKRGDINGDGTLTMAEAEDAVKKHVKKRSKGHNGMRGGK